MRIRVAHLSEKPSKVELFFQNAAKSRLAWITGTTEGDENLVSAATENGYTAVFSPDAGSWLAVRSDLIKEDTWVPNLHESTILAAFETTVAGLGEIIIAAGDDVAAEELADTLGFSLLFYGGEAEDGTMINYYDPNGRVRKLTMTSALEDKFFEGVLTVV